VILQYDRVASLRSIIAAPLVGTTAGVARSRLRPSIEVADRRYLIVVEQLAAVEPNALSRVIASADSIRYEIVAALDLLLAGI